MDTMSEKYEAWWQRRSELPAQTIDDEPLPEAEILLSLVTDKVREYWREYDRWVAGKRDFKPEVNDDIQTYWRTQSRLRAERRARENRELHEYLDEQEHNRKDPNIALEYWGTTDVADFFGVRPGTVLYWRKRGWLTGFRPGSPNGYWKFDRQEIEDLYDDASKLSYDLRRFMPRLVHSARNHQGRQG